MPSITSINPETNEIPTPKVIDRETVEQYCAERNINVYEMLLDIVEKGSSDLSEFIVSQGGSEIANKSAGVLHGSPALIAEFEPRVSKGGGNKNKEEPLIYASDDPNYAIFMAIIKLKSGGASTGYYNGQIRCSVDLDFVNGPSEISDGYVYVLDGNSFEKDSTHHLTSPIAQEPMFGVPVTPQDLQAGIHVDRGIRE